MLRKGYDPATECELHLLERCAFCTGLYSCLESLEPEPAPATPSPAKKRAHVDPAMVIADLVAEGKMCSSCLTLYAPIGCECSRRARFDRAVPDSQEWLTDHATDLDTGKRGSRPELIAAGLAFTSYARGARRAGVPRDGYPNRPSDQEADRLDILERFGVEAKWSPARTVQADFLPV